MIAGFFLKKTSGTYLKLRKRILFLSFSLERFCKRCKVSQKTFQWEDPTLPFWKLQTVIYGLHLFLVFCCPRLFRRRITTTIYRISMSRILLSKATAAAADIGQPSRYRLQRALNAGGMHWMQNAGARVPTPVFSRGAPGLQSLRWSIVRDQRLRRTFLCKDVLHTSSNPPQYQRDLKATRMGRQS